MKTRFGFALCIVFFAANLAAARSFADAQAEAELLIQSENALSTASISTRLEFVSRAFLNKPYLLGGPLGEGPGARYDQDPLYRFDGFDCTTFIETALALSVAHDFPQFLDRLLKLRYQNGQISFTSRNHFVELDWNPNNIAAGFFADRTLELGTGSDQAIAVQNFSKRNWYEGLPLSSLKLPGLTASELEARLGELHREGNQFEDSTSKLPYLRKASLRALKDVLPVPAVLNIVRQVPASKKADMVRVTHQVLLLMVGSELHVRAASSRTGIMRVVDYPYDVYVQSLIDSPSTLGVNVLSLLP